MKIHQSEMSARIQLCAICDSGYAVPTSVMLTSAKLNKAEGSQYHINLISNGLTCYEKRKFLEMSSGDFQIDIIECDGSKYEGIPIASVFSTSVMIKCDLADILSELDKVLLLDGDILVKKDLTELWNIDLGDNILAACSDMVGVVGDKLHELVGTPDYFNAGVMLLNLDVMRKEDIGQKVVETKLAAPPTWTLPEQDPYNVVCNGRWVKLPVKWNTSISLFKYFDYSISAINDYYGTHYGNYTELEDESCLMHFCVFKPWKNKLMHYADVWQKYHDMSPYGDTNSPHEPGYPSVPVIKTTDIRLFGLVPFIRYVNKVHREDCYMFGFIRLYKIKKRKDGRREHLLFGFIPCLMLEQREVNSRTISTCCRQA